MKNKFDDYDLEVDAFDFLEEEKPQTPVKKKPSQGRQAAAVKKAAPVQKKKKAPAKKAAAKKTPVKKTVEKRTPVKKAAPVRKKAVRKKKSRRQDNALLSAFKSMTAMMSDMSMADKIVASTGVLVLVVALVTGSVYVNAKALDTQIASFEELGEQLGAIGVSGESGLMAVTDAQIAAMNAVIEETETEETETQEAQGEKEVLLNMTSVEKDLKIKFINRAGGKLISGLPFEVKVTDPDKKTVSYKDDDKDGIIYKKDLKPGAYQVALVENDALSEYEYSTKPVSVTVKDKIEYKQIDVIDEIKTEAQVNVAQEDTAIQEAETAPALKDTVEWVESTKTPVGSSGAESGEFEEVAKKNIADPAEDARRRKAFYIMEKEGEGTESISTESSPSEGSESNGSESNGSESNGSESNGSESNGSESNGSESGGGNGGGETPKPPEAKVTGVSISGSAAIDIGKTVSLSAKVEGENLSDSDKGISWKSSDGSVASVNDSGVVTGVKAGTVTITATSKKDTSKSASCSVTVNKAAVTISLDKTSLSMKTGEETTLSASVSSGSVNWSSSNAGIVKVENGKVTAVSVGAADITATATEDTSKTAVCKVTVTAAGTLSVSFDKTALTVFSEDKKELTAAAKDANGAVTYSFSSDNTSVATVAGSNEKGTVTGVKAGTANITVTAKDASGTVASVSCKVTVKLNPKKDTSTKLKDKDGNQLYIKNSKGEFVEAVLADYYTADKFYKKAKNITYKYTGWQTIDGKTYFYDKNGKVVTGEQIIQGAKYQFDNNGALITNSSSGIMGIDVSKWNGTINWTAVKASGVNYVIIRCGYRGSSTGALIQDPKFKANIQGAAAAGIKVGVYFFSQAINEVEAVEEASMTLSLIKGHKLSYPVFLDVESSGGRADKLDKNTRTAVINAYCKTIQNGGYKAGVYANKTWLEGKMNAASLSGYKIWLAQYAAAPTYKATRYDMWQYTSKGKINGINGNVDLNISYLGY